MLFVKRLYYFSANQINKVANHIKSCFGLVLMKLGLLDRFVLVRMDGGICSQMHFYMIGELFRAKGYPVKFELEWFRKYGKDMNGNFARNFDLIRAFPHLDFQEASTFERFIYMGFKFYNDWTDVENSMNFLNLVPPIYLTGYYATPKGCCMDLYTIFTMDISILDHNNREIYEKIRQNESTVAIHVRRGDLSSYCPSYGSPVDSEYIKHSMTYIESKVGKAFYFIFSDEPDWVKSCLIDELPFDHNYFVVDINGSDKGYMDLFLIAACAHQITSKGSLGKYGAFLCSNKNNIITVYDDECERINWEGQHPNIIFIK